MSSRHLLVVMALTSILVVPGAASQGVTGDTLADLLLRDEIQRAEARLAALPRSAETVAFQGEIEYRKGNFESAQSLYWSALGMDASTPRAHFGLGKLAMAKLKLEDAAAALSKAIDLDPREPIYRLYMSDALMTDKQSKEAEKHLKEYLRLNPPDVDRVTGAKAGLEVLTAFEGMETGTIEAPQRPAPIPLQKTFNLLFADALVDGKGPFRFVIDTGATQTVLSDRLAMQLGLQSITSTLMHGVGGTGKVDSYIYRLNRLQLGDVVVKNIPVGTFADPMIAQIADGIIGTAMLADFAITVNYPQSRLELVRSSTSSGPAGSGAANAIPVWCISNLLLLPVEVNGQHRGNFLIDTGAVTSVLSHGMAKQLGVTEDTPGAKLPVPIAGVGGSDGSVLVVPGVTLKTPVESKRLDQVVAINLQEISRMLQTEISGVLGYDFLQNYKLTLDYYRAEIRLESSKE